MQPQAPTMKADMTQSDGELRIDWSFLNNAAEALYVCVRASIAHAPSAAPYTYLREDDSVLAATFRRMPIPPNMEIYAPEIPFYRLLEPGQSTEEACAIKVPIREIHPYCEREYPKDSLPGRISKIAFSVEYFWQRDEHFATHTPHDPVLVKAGGGKHFLLEKTLQLDRSATVLKRCDAFFRY